MGNIVNRVFDSSGPEGKVRGTPQQIIDKYLMLARDAQLGNDRVAEQNFLQHAEHYTRMLGEAQAELLREQAERQTQQGGNGGQGHQGGDRQPRDQHRHDPRVQDEDEPQPDLPAFLTNAQSDEGSSLVETPESAQQRSDHGERPERRERRDEDRPYRDRQTDRGERQGERQGERHGGERRDRNERRNRPDREDRKERPAQPVVEEAPAPVTEAAPQPVQQPTPPADLFEAPAAAPQPAAPQPAATEPAPPVKAASVENAAEPAEAPAKPARAPRKPRAPRAPKPAAESGDGQA